MFSKERDVHADARKTLDSMRRYIEFSEDTESVLKREIEALRDESRAWEVRANKALRDVDRLEEQIDVMIDEAASVGSHQAESYEQLEAECKHWMKNSKCFERMAERNLLHSEMWKFIASEEIKNVEEFRTCKRSDGKWVILVYVFGGYSVSKSAVQYFSSKYDAILFWLEDAEIYDLVAEGLETI